MKEKDHKPRINRQTRNEKWKDTHSHDLMKSEKILSRKAELWEVLFVESLGDQILIQWKERKNDW